MHRIISVAVLSFWAVLFGSLAHLSLSSFLSKAPQSSSELQLLITSAGHFQIMPVVLMMVAALFIWAVLALVTSDDIAAFREVEAYSYGTAIFIMCACAILAVVNFEIVGSLPSLFVAALITCAASSQHLSLTRKPEDEIDLRRLVARQMALGAVHNSLLSRVSGRPLRGQNKILSNALVFPLKPKNEGDR